MIFISDPPGNLKETLNQDLEIGEVKMRWQITMKKLKVCEESKRISFVGYNK
jgi:hypothetical protein